MSQITNMSPTLPGKPHDEPIVGILWMLLSCSLLAGVATLGRYLAINGVPPLQIVFLRVFFALVTMLPMFLHYGTDLLRTRQLTTYLIRVLIGVLGMMTWFIGLATIPVGEVTAISFLTPLFATLFAALLLGEVVRIRRWAATVVGFCGSLIILRPGLADVPTGMWIVVLSAISMGLSSTYIKRLTNQDYPNKVVFISTLLMMPITLLPALSVWVWPEPRLWFFILLLGPVATLAHITLARAFSATEASIVMGVDFARLPFAVGYGYLVFGELIDGWTWVGAGVIMASSIYIARREAAIRAGETAAAATRTTAV